MASASLAPRKLSGLILSLEISGFGPNSSELVIAVQPDAGPNEALVMEYDAVPQMFAAAVTMLTAAYYAKSRVTIVVPVGQPAGNTPKISGVLVPALP